MCQASKPLRQGPIGHTPDLHRRRGSTTNPNRLRPRQRLSHGNGPHLLMAESVRMVAMGDLMFFRSQTLTVRSSLPETTLSPTVNTAEVTVLQGKHRVRAAGRGEQRLGTHGHGGNGGDGGTNQPLVGATSGCRLHPHAAPR